MTPERYAKRKLKGLPRAELLYTADTLPDVKKIYYTTGFTFSTLSLLADVCHEGHMACKTAWLNNSTNVLQRATFGGPDPQTEHGITIITTVLWPLYTSTCVSQHLQLRTSAFCWCNSSIQIRKKMAVVLNRIIYTISIL